MNVSHTTSGTQAMKLIGAFDKLHNDVF